MLIKYKPNPLMSTIELDPVETLVVYHRIGEEAAKSKIITIKVARDNKETDRMNKELDDPFSYYGQPFKEHMDEELKYMIEALKDVHCGDCTCVPCSCTKCRAESYAGFDTVKGLRQHPASYVQSAFTVTEDGKFKEHHEDLALSLKILGEPVVATEEWHKDHVERWAKEKEDARAWLQSYADTLANTEVTMQMGPALDW